MYQEHDTIKAKKFKHLSERERYRIEDLSMEGLTPLEISKRLGRDRRTIEREIKRGKVELLKSDLTKYSKYCADAGQRIHDEHGRNKGPSLKIGNEHKLVADIEKKIKEEKYSPDAAIMALSARKSEYKCMICTKTLYNYIDAGLFLGISNKDLPVKRNKSKQKYKKVRIARNNTKGTSIENRPTEVETREEYGHFEMDLVVGKQGGDGVVLLVLTERKTRQELIRKLPNKEQKSVILALDNLEKEYKNDFYSIFKTITCDNGSEFLDFESLERSVINPNNKRTTIYFAHPYSSYERGSNENANKLIRRFIPKGTDFGHLSNDDIERIQNWINNYPRRKLSCYSANQLLAS